MKSFFAFLKKELCESVRTYKFLILITVFSVFGITNPLVAKLLPELLAGFMPDGMVITLAEPTALDAWAQFFDNITEIGMIVLVLVFSGVLANELSKGTLINMLTKGLSRWAVILSKYTCMVLLWTISIAVCFGFTFLYTLYLFPGEKADNLLFAVFCLWLFGALLLIVLLFSATLSKSISGSLLITGVAVFIGLLANINPKVHKYNPISLAMDSPALLTKSIEVSALYPAILISIGLTILLCIASVLIFKKKQL